MKKELETIESTKNLLYKLHAEISLAELTNDTTKLSKYKSKIITHVNALDDIESIVNWGLLKTKLLRLVRIKK